MTDLEGFAYFDCWSGVFIVGFFQTRNLSPEKMKLGGSVQQTRQIDAVEDEVRWSGMKTRQKVGKNN